MKKFKYEEFRIEGGLIDGLNRLGDDGWELIKYKSAMEPQVLGVKQDIVYYAIMKKEYEVNN